MGRPFVVLATTNTTTTTTNTTAQYTLRIPDSKMQSFFVSRRE
jgi:hypothetical protein